MKFGARPLASAEGTILAHSVQTLTGRLRKGQTLVAQDIAALAAAGHDSVICAKLDADDVDENTAAAELAAAVLGPTGTLSQGTAFTGRCNLIAPGAGVVELDVARLEAVNAVHPMITIATVPPHQQMAKGGLVATIKIISYGVPKAALADACAAAQDGAVTFHPPKLRSATLIISQIERGAGDKGRDAIAGRLAALDVTLEQVVMVAHETGALAQAIGDAKSDLVLVLTGSATSDIEDVAPSALRLAGGHVTRFGMPVDPGNLLFLGALAGRPVIGLPGCARSPALNGADWVMSRIICGIDVTARDIAGMGVGGLLKEIATRPQPRRAERSTE